MKRFFLLLTVLLILPAGGNCLAGGTSVSAQTGFEYTWWRDSEKNIGYQVLVPVKLGLQRKAFSVNVLGGYGYSGFDSKYDGLTTASQLLDTKVNLSYTLLDKLPVDVLFGLDFNLPTANLDFSRRQRHLYMDSDLVSLSQLGEGFNINPTLSVAKEWDRLITGIGIGYVWRGTYDYYAGMTDYDPGDLFTVTAEARYDFSPLWSARLFGQYARFGKDELEKETLYREGDVYIGGVGLQYAPPSWNAALTLRYIFRDKSELPSYYSSDVLDAMSNSIHGNETVGDLVVNYLWSKSTTLWIRVTGLYVQANDYPDTSHYYIGQRQKASLELGWKRAFGQRWETNLFVRGFTMHDDNRNFPDSIYERTYNGFSAGGYITAKF